MKLEPSATALVRRWYFGDRMYHDFLKSLLARDSFLIVTHARPDGDAIGSQLALGEFLRQLGKRVILAGPDDIPQNLVWLDPLGTVETFTGSPEQVVRFGEVDAVVIVDANSASRIGELNELVSGHRGDIFVVDHHPDPEPGYEAYLVETAAASTGEIVYELIVSYDTDLIDGRMPVALYAAIMTDTGSFRYGNVTPRLFEIVADLFRRGNFTVEEVYNRIYKTRSEAGQLLLGQALQTLTITAGGRLGYMKVTRRMFDLTGASSEDVDAFTDPILAIEGVEVAILFMEVGIGVKMSFRSQGDIPVNELAQNFGGGGHRNASGGFVTGRIESVIPRVLEAARSIIPVDTSN